MTRFLILGLGSTQGTNAIYASLEVLHVLGQVDTSQIHQGLDYTQKTRAIYHNLVVIFHPHARLGRDIWENVFCALEAAAGTRTLTQVPLDIDILADADGFLPKRLPLKAHEVFALLELSKFV